MKLVFYSDIIGGDKELGQAAYELIGKKKTFWGDVKCFRGGRISDTIRA
jgi:hypothetical protein